MKRWTSWLLLLWSGFPTVIVGGTLVQFRTVLGNVEVELLDQEKPVTSSNFLRYLREDAYATSFFHRQVPGFIIQGGGFWVQDFATPTARFAAIPTHPPITNEFAAGPLVSNTHGTLAMAKAKDPNSATSQFFFNLADNRSSLDNPANSGGFTVFGRVVAGAETLERFDSFVYRRPEGVPLTNLVVNMGSKPFPFSEIPVALLSTNSNNQFEVRFENLIFVDITTLKVAVRDLPDGSREISWEGLAQANNIVEYTTTFPPNWQTLTNLSKPTQLRPLVLDHIDDAKRFYRVRVEF